MHRHHRALNIAGFIAISLVALVLWPQRWGGTMTYDITHGASMQPTFHTGDLAILRKAGSYEVGDVAAYRSATLHTTVMHRIKTKTSQGYTFKGDNNDFVDPDTVTEKEMLGRLIFRVPKVGTGLTWLVDPLHLVIAIGGIFLLFSDRRERTTVAPPSPTPAPVVMAAPLVVRITALRLPQELPTADVATAEDLERLASLYSLAILRDVDIDYVLHSGMVFRYDRAESAVVGKHELRRRPSPLGRDWVYGQADVIDIASRRDAVS